MSATTRNGKKVRASWSYSSGNRESSMMQQLEMMESCRNVMEEVRDELKALNRTFSCTAFLAIPFTLKRISRNTAKPRRKKRQAQGAGA
jgi:hypothetical protein